MKQIRTWFISRREGHCNCNCHDHEHEQTRDRPPEVNEPDDKPVTKPEDIPVKKVEETPIEKPADTPADTHVRRTTKKIESNQASVPTPSRRIKVIVVPVLEDNDTTASAIAKGIAKVYDTIKMLNRLAARSHPGVTATILSIITDVINTMATVHDQQKPRRTHAYHVYATRTVIASYINIRALLFNTYPGALGIGAGLSHAFSACVYLGMAILVTPAPYSARLASEIAHEIHGTGIWKTLWPSKGACRVAEDITKRSTPEFVTCGRAAPRKNPPSPPLLDLHPLVSILTSKELAGLVRGLAFRQRDTYGTDRTIKDAAEILESLFVEMKTACLCRAENYPVCFCKLKPMSQDEYQDLGGRLLPRV